MSTSTKLEEGLKIRKYINKNGFAHVLGYVNYPLKDNFGVYYQEGFLGVDGVERSLDAILNGESGLKIIETDARCLV